MLLVELTHKLNHGITFAKSGIKLKFEKQFLNIGSSFFIEAS
jgi:hypothetical protein